MKCIIIINTTNNIKTYQTQLKNSYTLFPYYACQNLDYNQNQNQSTILPSKSAQLVQYNCMGKTSEITINPGIFVKIMLTRRKKKTTRNHDWPNFPWDMWCFDRCSGDFHRGDPIAIINWCSGENFGKCFGRQVYHVNNVPLHALVVVPRPHLWQLGREVLSRIGWMRSAALAALRNLGDSNH